MLRKRGYRDAFSFVRTVPWIDPDRIGIRGTSYSGGSDADAALTRGYASPSASASMFRRQIGTPPSAFRAERRRSRAGAEIV